MEVKPQDTPAAFNRVRERLGQYRLILASNREPYVHRKGRGGQMTVDRPAGGVTAVLDPLLQSMDGTWVAWGSGDSDREVVDAHDRVRVPPNEPAYTLRRVWMSPEEVKDYYHGYSNRFLWPLCHVTLDRVAFRQKYWDAFRRVNERFAGAILEEVGQQRGLVWVHDYQLALCPFFLKQQRSDLRVALFWHIPWPSYDVFRICPQRKELLSAMLACDQLGFHLDSYRWNFLECVERELGIEADREKEAVVVKGHRTLVSAVPVSIDFGNHERMAASPDTDKRMAGIRKRLRINPGMVVGLGVDRLDYTKGFLKRLWALDEFLSRYPDMQRRFLFIQVAAPTRAESEPYRSYRGILQSTVMEINEKFGRDGWRPIVYIESQLSHEVLAAYYRLADFCFVSSVYDGMNLVSKEYVASRIENSGVLLLSEMAGSLDELDGAIPVNPYDVEGMARAIHSAIEMSKDEQRVRMTRMRTYIQKNDIYRWMQTNLETILRADQ